MSSKKLTFTKIVFFLLICFSFLFSTKNIMAREVDADGNPIETETKRASGSLTLSDEIKQEIIDKNDAMDEVSSEGLGRSMFFTNALIPITVLSGDNVTAMLNDPKWTPSGLIGLANSATASLYNPPISGTQYIANSINNLLGKPTYAASTGGAFNSLKGILPLWKTCRNAVYSLFSIFFVIIGLLIMLRIKISPQATITIQNSIPKIIVTLILVTFSYAIIGLIIDLTYLAQALILSLLTNNGSTLIANLDITTLIKGSFDTFNSLSKAVMYSSNLTAANVTLGALGFIVGAIIGGITGAIGGPIGIAIGAGAGGVIGTVVGILILLIFVLIQTIKFFFGCAKAYIVLLIKIILAPFEIALGAFPNSKIGFGSWFIQTLAYASVFPISLIFLVFLNIICDAVSFTNMWTPGVLESSIVSPYIGSILGMAGLIILAKLPDLVPEAIFQIKPSPFGKALTEGAKAYPGHRIVGAAKGVVTSGINFYAGQTVNDFMQRTKFGEWVNIKTGKKRAERVDNNSNTQSNKPNRQDDENDDF